MEDPRNPPCRLQAGDHGLTDKFKVVSGAAFHRGENNIGLIEIDGSGVVSMYATVASDYWSANIVFPCA